MFIQLALLIEIQPHEEFPFTVTEPLPPPDEKAWLVELKLKGVLVAVKLVVAESLFATGSIAEEETVATLVTRTLLSIAQLTVAKMLTFIDAPTSSDPSENVMLLPAREHEPLQKLNCNDEGNSSLTVTWEARSGPLLVTVMLYSRPKPA